MSTIPQIADQLRATNFEHVRAIIEPEDVTVLIDYLEGQGFISAAAQAVKDAEAEAKKAEPAAEPEVVLVDEPAEPLAEPKQVVALEDMTKDELLEHADSVGAEVSKSDNKAEIVKAIKKAEKAKNK